MRRVVACCVLSLLLAATLLAGADERDRSDGRVHDLMERTHEGRRSPYGQLRRMVAGGDAPWPVVAQAVAGFEPMCRALLSSQNAEIKGSADGYVDAVKELVTAVRRRDAKAVRAGFEALEQSCGDCHYKGGIGGRLESEEQEHDHGNRRGGGDD